MMVDFIINTSSLKENIFLAVDVYNDAASSALHEFSQQHLYDEVPICEY
jgi:hypothetical protein